MKLSDREIVRLHQLAQSGTPDQELARIFQVNRNTISSHLSLRVRYSRETIQKLGIKADLPTGEVLSIYAASAYLPGWPRQQAVYQLYRDGVLAARKRPLKAGRQLRICLTCKPADIKRAALKMADPGIWYTLEALSQYVSDWPTVQRAMKDAAVPLKHLRRQSGYLVKAPTANRICRKADVELVVPAVATSRALAVQTVTTVGCVY